MKIYCTQISPRLQYIADLISNRFGVLFQLTTNVNENIAINYSDSYIENTIQIYPVGLLHSEGVQHWVIENTIFENLPAPFRSSRKCDFGFDVFAAIFYLLTRYEEHLLHQQNQYGQYQAKDSWAFKNNVLHKPIVDIWLQALQTRLLEKFTNLSFTKSVFSYQITYDIDSAYYYAGKPFLKQIGLLTKDILLFNFNQFKKRLSSIVNYKNDIANTYQYIIDVNEKQKPIFFFLMGDKHARNTNLPHHHKLMKQLITDVKDYVEIGIHPSYETPRNQKLIAEEKLRLENLLAATVTKSRQHYLRFYLPTTYNYLIANGITDDYTMGYAEQPGFRAGTSMPYKFYDIVEEETKPLTIHPITFMEGSFAEDLQLNPEEALPQMISLINEVKEVGGQFICIWHNHSLSDYGFWNGWKAVHDEILNELTEND